MKLTLENRIIGGFLLALLVVTVIGAVSYQSIRRLTDDAESVKHTQEVLTHLTALLSTTADAETARTLKSDPALKVIRIVAVTSYAMVGDREKVFAAGAEGYIEKPINPETFVSEIERFLHRCTHGGAG